MVSELNRVDIRDGSGRTRLPDGTKIGRYEVSFLSVGGMSLAYKGVSKGKTYVLKEVETTNTKDVPSLISEKSLLERLDHPGLVDFEELIIQDGYYYLVVEYVPGKPLTELMASDKKVSVEQAVDWGVQLTEIFDYLHNCNPAIIYRDLKPGNILLADGQIKLIDFGIARVHKGDRQKDTALFGSAQTASPEHFGRSETDARSDIYTLGATLHLLLAGFETKKAAAFQFQSLKDIVADFPVELSDVIDKSLALEPEDRYSTAIEFRDALLTATGQTPPAAPSPLRSSTALVDGAPDKRGSNLKWLALLAVGFFVCIGLLGLVGDKASEEPRGVVASQEEDHSGHNHPPGEHPEDDHSGQNHPPGEHPEDDHSGHNHPPGEHPKEVAYGGKSSGLEEANLGGDIFGAGVVDERDIVMLGEDVGLFEVTDWKEETGHKRAETVSGRLNSFYHQFCAICGKSKLEPEDIRVGRHVESNSIAVFFSHTHSNGLTFAGPLLLATVNQDQAKEAGVTPRFLAANWRDLLRDTVQISRGFSVHESVLGEELEQALEKARDKIKTGEVSIANLRKVLREVTGKESLSLQRLFLRIAERAPSFDEFEAIKGYEPLKS